MPGVLRTYVFFNKKCAVLVHRGVVADRHADLQIDNYQPYIAALSSGGYIKVCLSEGGGERASEGSILEQGFQNGS